MTKYLFLVLSALMASASFADSLDNTQNCVIVYVKKDASQPNLTLACDGERILSDTISTEDQLGDPQQFHASLYQMFQEMVNTSGRKTCNQYENETVWWASCLTQ